MNARHRRASRHPLGKQSSLIKPPLASEPFWPKYSHGENTPEKHRAPSVGTALADSIEIRSEASFPTRRWGGARNSASRTSDSLSLNQAANIIAAAHFAAAIGLPLNRFLTIHWEHAGIPDERAAWATGRFLKLAGDWIAKRSGRISKVEQNRKRIAWAWVRENGDGKGSHVHILLHVPANKIVGKNQTQLGNMPRRWLRSITGKPYCAGTIKTARIGGTTGAAHSSPAAYHENLAAVVGYVLKGTSSAAAPALALDRLEAGGRIVGKRAATSQNIGRAARERTNKKGGIFRLLWGDSGPNG